MRYLSVLGLVLCSCLNIWGANPWSPSVEFGERMITASPAKFHLSPSKAKLEIVESEGCEAKLQSPHIIQFAERCEFLRGVYQYSFKQSGSESSLKVYSEFVLHQNSIKSRSYILNSPIIIHEDLAVKF